ncbi:uncharacterized protein LOC132726036 [Ruditapes philippinarum]|uniref:uncharacterized protein LOC132726036 n=1 Tax=Ruditapes philippinarum TaxID=129788 RepID=UPI00295B8AFE|nr:uncharacterized protein LOC132726036 [Ruditapes philippinarum]
MLFNDVTHHQQYDVIDLICLFNMEDVVTNKRCREKNIEDRDAQFLMVDYGEQLAQELEEARNELYKQVTSVGTKVQLLWEVVRTLVVFTIPIITGIGITVLSQSYLPRTLAVVVSTICNGITIGLVFLNITPLNAAINNYVGSRIYTPSFVNCSCKACHDRNNCSHDQQENQHDNKDSAVEHKLNDGESGATNDIQDVSEQSRDAVNNVSTSDTVGTTAGDNDETFSKRNFDTESNST